MSTAAALISSMGITTHDSGGVRNSAISKSCSATTLSCSGTGRPSSRAARSTPGAMLNTDAKIAVTSGCSSRIDRAAVSPCSAEMPPVCRLIGFTPAAVSTFSKPRRRRRVVSMDAGPNTPAMSR